MIRIALALLLWMTVPLAAQQEDSRFASYAEYSAFVDRAIATRDFGALIQNLGGRDEYTPEQLAGVVDSFLRIYPVDFDQSQVFRTVQMGGGFRQEGRAYWTGTYYIWYYAFLHDTGSELVVIYFALNSSAETILSQF